MSQILLFMNKPHEFTQGGSTVCARLNSYQSVLAACQKHSREIVGIALAQSDKAVRVYSVQALFTAGQCLGDVRERQTVLDLIRDVEIHFSANHFNYMIPTAFSRRSHLHAAFCVDRLHLREEVTRRGEDTQGHRTTWVS